MGTLLIGLLCGTLGAIIGYYITEAVREKQYNKQLYEIIAKETEFLRHL